MNRTPSASTTVPFSELLKRELKQAKQNLTPCSRWESLGTRAHLALFGQLLHRPDVDLGGDFEIMVFPF